MSIEADPNLVELSQQWLNKQGKNIEVVQEYGFPVFEFEDKPQIEGFTSGGVSLGGRVQFTAGSERSSGSLDSGNVFDLKSIAEQFDLEPNLLIIDIEGSERFMLEQKPNFPMSVNRILIELHPNIYGQDTMLRIKEVIVTEGYSEPLGSGDSFLFER